MRIEPARTDDIADYVAIAAAAESMLRARGLAQWVPAAHAAYRNTIVAQQADGSLFAVYDGSAPIAFCVVTLAKSPWWPPDDVAALYLSGIVVSRSARGRAVGHTIVAWAIARAESLGLGAVRLDCHSGSTWLRRYYEDLGFVLRGLVEQHPGYDGCLYELRCGGDTGTLDLIPTVVPQLRGGRSCAARNDRSGSSTLVRSFVGSGSRDAGGRSGRNIDAGCGRWPCVEPCGASRQARHSLGDRAGRSGAQHWQHRS